MRIMTKTSLSVVFFALLCLALVSTAVGKTADKNYKEAAAGDVEAFVQKNKGKVIVVNVFATWCSPCVTETPDFVKIRSTYPEDGVAMLAVSIDEDKQAVLNFIKEQKISYPVYRVGEDFTTKYKIDSVPQTYIHDRSGKLYKHIDGMTTFEELQENIEHLLASSPEPGNM